MLIKLQKFILLFYLILCSLLQRIMNQRIQNQLYIYRLVFHWIQNQRYLLIQNLIVRFCYLFIFHCIFNSFLIGIFYLKTKNCKNAYNFVTPNKEIRNDWFAMINTQINIYSKDS